MRAVPKDRQMVDHSVVSLVDTTEQTTVPLKVVKKVGWTETMSAVRTADD